MDREDWEESEQECRERAYVNLRDSILLVVAPARAPLLSPACF